MPKTFDISGLDGREITVTWNGFPFTVVYRPVAASRKKLREYQRRLQEATEQESADIDLPDQTIQLMLDLVKEWGVAMGGEIVPLTYEGVESVPIPVLNAIRQQIFTDVGESPKATKTTSMTG